MRLRSSSEGDYPFLWRLHCLLLKGYTEETWGWVEEDQRTKFGELVDPVSWQVIEVDGVDAGALAVGEEPEVQALKYIALLPEFQGRGIGTALVKTVLLRAAVRQVPVRLNVFAVNSRAQEFYRRLGFVVVGALEGRLVMEAVPAAPCQ